MNVSTVHRPYGVTTRLARLPRGRFDFADLCRGDRAVYARPAMSGERLPAWLGLPSLRVDVPRLRETLDAVRAALSSPRGLTPTISAVALVHDRAQVAANLRYILDRLDGVDLTTSRALSSVVREFRPHAQADRLRALFADIDAALRERLRSRLGEDKVATIARLVRSPAPDVLRILGKEDHENSHSDFIAWLLNPRRAPVVAMHALRRLVGVLPDHGQWADELAGAIADDSLSVRREVTIARDVHAEDDLCRVDIVITGPSFVLVIENKVWSREHSDQTEQYWTWMQRWKGLRGGILLSPGGVRAGCNSFASVTYLDLVAALVDGPCRASITASEEIMLSSYLKTLARGILATEMRAVLQLADERGSDERSQ